jgi:hypothetical protein
MGIYVISHSAKTILLVEIEGAKHSASLDS